MEPGGVRCFLGNTVVWWPIALAAVGPVRGVRRRKHCRRNRSGFLRGLNKATVRPYLSTHSRLATTMTTTSPFDIADDGVGIVEIIAQIEAYLAAGRIERAYVGDAFDCDRKRGGAKDFITAGYLDRSQLPGL